MSKISSVSSFNNDIRRRPIVVAGAAGASKMVTILRQSFGPLAGGS